MRLLDDLIHGWTARSNLRTRAASWSWFEQAFRAAIDAQDRQGLVNQRCTVDVAALLVAFFAWVESLDANSSYEALDQLDFVHYASGVLLQTLLVSTPPVVACATAEARDLAVTSFVLSLLQALRIDVGAQPFEIDPACTGEAWVSGFFENVHEDSSMAICFLDQMTGLPPVWNGPTLIHLRPAMKTALGKS